MSRPARVSLMRMHRSDERALLQCMRLSQAIMTEKHRSTLYQVLGLIARRDSQ
jgi:hypothetical protein